MNSLLQKYQYNILNRPVRTFALQSSIMMTLGDVVSQQAIEKKGFKNHDVERSLRMTLYAALLGGPLTGTWFNFLNNSTANITNKWKATLVRVAIDQAVFSPSILAIFMGGISILEGRNLQEIKEKYQHGYLKGLMNAYRFWPFVNLFTFAFIPVYYRPFANSCFGIAWNSYLSYLNQSASHLLQPYKAHQPIIAN